MAAADNAPVKEDDPYYNRGIDVIDENDRELITDEYYENIVNNVKDNKKIGKLPSFDEFKAETDYQTSMFLSLTNFREMYGKGTSFTRPDAYDFIYITDVDEFYLLSSLVNGTAENETAAERAFYASARYKMVSSVEMNSSTIWYPIGNTDLPFTGTFEGSGCKISNFTIDGTRNYTYSEGMAFGLFGVIGTGGIVKNVEVDINSINIKYVVGSAIGGIAGINRGTIENAIVLGTYSSSTLDYNSDFKGLAHSNIEVKASNSTYGGIAGENYGTIKQVFSDTLVEIHNTDAAYTVQPVVAVNDGSLTDAYFIKYEEFKSLYPNYDNKYQSPSESKQYFMEHDDALFSQPSYKQWQVSSGNPKCIGWAVNNETTSEVEPYDYPGGYWAYVPPTYDLAWYMPGTTSEFVEAPLLDENGNKIPEYKSRKLTSDEVDALRPYEVLLDSSFHCTVYNEELDCHFRYLSYCNNIYGEYGGDDSIYADDFRTFMINTYGSMPDMYMEAWDDSQPGEPVRVMGYVFGLKPSYTYTDYDDITYTYDSLTAYKNSIPQNSIPYVNWLVKSTDCAQIVDYNDVWDAWADYCRSKLGYWHDDERFDDESGLTYYTYVLDADGKPVQATDDQGNLLWKMGMVQKYTYIVYEHNYDDINGEGLWYSDIAESMDFGGLLEKGSLGFDTIHHGLVYDAEYIAKNLGNEEFAKNLYEHYKDSHITIAFGGSDMSYYGSSDFVLPVWNILACAVNNRAGTYYEYEGGHMGGHSWNEYSYTPNEYAQKLISKAHIYLSGAGVTESFTSISDGAYVSTGSGYDDKKDCGAVAMGTDEFPFNGIVDGIGNKFVTSSPTPLMGTIGSDGKLQNIILAVNSFIDKVTDKGTYYNIKDYVEQYDSESGDWVYKEVDKPDVLPTKERAFLVKNNKGTVSNVNAFGLVSYNESAGLDAADVNYNRRIISESFRFDYNYHLSVLTNTIKDILSDYFTGDNMYYVIENNDGVMETVKSSIDLCLTDCDSMEFRHGYGGNPAPEYVLFGSASFSTHYTNNYIFAISQADVVKTGSADGSECYNLVMDTEPWYDYSGQVQPWDPCVLVPGETYRAVAVEKYPTFKSHLSVSDDGKYHLKTAFDLLYFLLNARDDDVGVLDNTIDMTGAHVVAPNRNGHAAFVLDGTLTDENDICADIDLGIDKKCYGIIGLDIESCISNKATFKNLYFIGGSIKVGVRDIDWSKSVPGAHGTYASEKHDVVYHTDNVHISSDYLIEKVSYNDINTFACEANDCSYSGDVVITGNLDNFSNYYAFSVIGISCYDCINWGTFSFEDDTVKKTSNSNGRFNNYCQIKLYGIGENVHRGYSYFDVSALSRTTFNTRYYKDSNKKYSTIYLLGRNCYDCKIDNVIENGDFPVNTYLFNAQAVFGNYAYGCAFTGTYKQAGIPYLFDTGGRGFVYTEDSVRNTSDGNHGVYGISGVLFEGTVYAGTTVNSAVGTNCNYGFSRGKIIVDDYTRIYGVGQNNYGFVTNNTYEFVNTNNVTYPTYYVWLYGSTHLTNGSAQNVEGIIRENITLNNDKCNMSLIGFDQSSYGGMNYGKADLNVRNAYVCYFRSEPYYCRNFADCKVIANNSAQVFAFDGSCYEVRNYGNFDLECRNLDFGGIFYNFARWNLGYDMTQDYYSSNINVGDFTIRAWDYTKGYMAKRGINYGNVEICGSEHNAATIRVIGSTSNNYGDIYIHDVDTHTGDVNADVEVYSVEYMYSNRPYSTSAQGSIKLENVFVGSSLVVAPIRVQSTDISYDSDIITDCQVDIKNCKARGSSISGSMLITDFYSWRSVTLNKFNLNANVNLNVDGLTSNMLGAGDFVIFGGIGYRNDHTLPKTSDKFSTGDVYGTVNIKNVTQSYENSHVFIMPFAGVLNCSRITNDKLVVNVENVKANGNLSQLQIANRNIGESFYSSYTLNVKNTYSSGNTLIGLLRDATKSFVSNCTINTENVCSGKDVCITGGVCSVPSGLGEDTNQHKFEFHNLGDITVKYTDDDYTFKNLYIGGTVGKGDLESSTAFVSNSGHITFDSTAARSSDIKVSDTVSIRPHIHIGGVYAGYGAELNFENNLKSRTFGDSKILCNAVNTGDIDVKSAVADYTNIIVGGVASFVDAGYSLINWGKINVDINESEDFYHSKLDEGPYIAEPYIVNGVAHGKTIKGCINYGDIYIEPNHPHTQQEYDEDTDSLVWVTYDYTPFAYASAFCGYEATEACLNYGDINYTRPEIPKSCMYVVDYTGRPDSVPMCNSYDANLRYSVGYDNPNDDDTDSRCFFVHSYAVAPRANAAFNPDTMPMWQRFRIGYGVDYDGALMGYLKSVYGENADKHWYIAELIRVSSFPNYINFSEIGVNADDIPEQMKGNMGTYDEIFRYRKALRSSGFPFYMKTLTYEDTIDPAFYLRYYGPIAVGYQRNQTTNAKTLKTEAGNFATRYIDGDKVSGKLKEFFDANYSDKAGIYVLDISSIERFPGSTSLVIGHNVSVGQALQLDNNETWLLDCAIGASEDNKTFDDYRNSLIQCNDASAPFYHTLTTGTESGPCVTSTKEYELNDGSTVKSHLKSVSSLICHQSPIDGDHDGKYSNKTYVTVEDLFLPVNGFKNVVGQTAEFHISQDVVTGSAMKYFDKKAVFDDYETAAIWVENKLSDEDDTLLNRAMGSDDNVSFKVPDVDESVYCVVGNNKAGDYNNILILGIHGVSRVPSAQLESFSYPVAINSDGEKLINSGYMSFVPEPEEDAGYTVDIGSGTSSRYGVYDYPIYHLEKDMYHTTDGLFDNDGNKINTTGDVNISLSTQDVNEIIFYITDETGKTCFTKFKMPLAGSFVNANGVSTANHCTAVLFGDSMKLTGENADDQAIKWHGLVAGTIDESDDIEIRNGNDSELNPFRLSGHKIVTALVDTGDGDIVKLFEVDFDKSVSSENYIKSKVFPRHDIIHDEDSDTAVDNVVISPAYFKYPAEFSYFDKGNTKVSTLGSGRKDVVSQYGDSVYYDAVHYDDGIVLRTSYDSTLTDTYIVTAEDGSEHTYTHKYVMPQIEKAPLTSIYNGGGNNYPFSVSSPILIVDDGVTEIDVSASYGNVKFMDKIFDKSYDAKLFAVYVYRDGEYIDTVYPTSNIAEYNGLQFGITGNKTICMRQGDDYDRTTFPIGVFTFEPIVDFGNNNRVVLEGFSMSKELLSDHRLISGKWQNVKSSTVISTIKNDMSDDIDIDKDGIIDYSKTADDVQQFYIVNSVEPDCAVDTFTMEIPWYSTLWKKVNNSWVALYTCRNKGETYIDSLSYTPEALGAGVTTEYKITAQNYDANDTARGRDKLVSYYTTYISAQTRNKYVTINFMTDTDEDTRNAFNEIIDNNGNISVELKKMRNMDMLMHQTKIYKSAADLESTYYPVTNGSYAIDVNVPEGYEFRVRLAGSSSEGQLPEYPYAMGRKISMPYPNEQHLTFEVYLKKVNVTPKWGVAYLETLFSSNRQNVV